MQYVLRLKASVLDYFIKLFPKKRGGLHLRFIRPVRKLEEREREREREGRGREREKGGVGRERREGREEGWRLVRLVKR